MNARTGVLALALAAAGAATACSESGSAGDAAAHDAGRTDGRPGRDSAIPIDAAPPDLGTIPDAMPRTDAGDLDSSVLTPDIGPPGTGESCTTAKSWEAPDVPVAGTTSVSFHREQLSCASRGANANAPEQWWTFHLDAPSRVVLSLGTLGWDGVLAARTGTCAGALEMCADSPEIVELPIAEGTIFVGVDGFANGSGPYAIRADVSAPLLIPAPNNDCTTARSAEPPFTALEHNYGGGTLALSACPMESAVFYALELHAEDAISLRAEPLAGQDLQLAVLDATCGSAIACARSFGHGVAEALGPLMLSPGSYRIAVGARADRPVPGSFQLSIGRAADCRKDADCPMGQRCTAELSCGAGGMYTVTSTARASIPDGAGALSIPIALAGPVERPRRVALRVAFEHPHVEDVEVELVSPGTPAVRVRLRNQSSGALDVTYGRDRPADGPGALEDFLIAPSAAGTWTLGIRDRAAGDRGFLVGYALDVE